jgi:hypothetical protein
MDTIISPPFSKSPSHEIITCFWFRDLPKNDFYIDQKLQALIFFSYFSRDLFSFFPDRCWPFFYRLCRPLKMRGFVIVNLGLYAAFSKAKPKLFSQEILFEIVICWSLVSLSLFAFESGVVDFSIAILFFQGCQMTHTLSLYFSLSLFLSLSLYFFFSFYLSLSLFLCFLASLIVYVLQPTSLQLAGFKKKVLTHFNNINCPPWTELLMLLWPRSLGTRSLCD